MCSASAEFEDFVLQFMDRYVKFGTSLVSRGLIAVTLLLSSDQMIYTHHTKTNKKLQCFKYYFENNFYTVCHIVFNITY